MPSTGKAESAKNKKMLGQQVRTAIEALHAENEELKKDLARETRQANLTATMGKGQGSQAARLQEEADLYLKKIENERNKIATLDAKISQCKKEMTAQRQKMGGVNAGKENHDMLVKQIKSVCLQNFVVGFIVDRVEVKQLFKSVHSLILLLHSQENLSP